MVYVTADGAFAIRAFGSGTAVHKRPPKIAFERLNRKQLSLSVLAQQHLDRAPSTLMTLQHPKTRC